MKIKELTITNDEVKEAVQIWIATKGINVPILDISKDYSWKTDWEVTFDYRELPKPEVEEPKAQVVEPKSYVSPITEALDREAKMHEADATETPTLTKTNL